MSGIRRDTEYRLGRQAEAAGGKSVGAKSSSAVDLKGNLGLHGYDGAGALEV
jgi:hypothetical protein